MVGTRVETDTIAGVIIALAGLEIAEMEEAVVVLGTYFVILAAIDISKPKERSANVVPKVDNSCHHTSNRFPSKFPQSPARPHKVATAVGMFVLTSHRGVQWLSHESRSLTSFAHMILGPGMLR